MKFRRAFIEITNVCNLSCGFCVKTARPACFMPVDVFERAARQVSPIAGITSLHVLGEPFMHPQLPEILFACSRAGLKINLVTNGTLLDKFGANIFSKKCLRQVSVSLHALSALPPAAAMQKLESIAEFAKHKPGNFIVSFRLRGDLSKGIEEEILNCLLNSFGKTHADINKRKAVKLADKTYLNFGGIFKWKTENATRKKPCLGLRHHFAILCTGEVLPCCIDYDGKMSVGNINEKPLADILTGPKAIALRNSISGNASVPDYCRSCGFHLPE